MYFPSSTTPMISICWVEELEAFSDNADGAEEAAGESLIHEGNGRRPRLVIWGEVASSERSVPATWK